MSSTDWDLVRKLMSSAIDTCERIEKSGLDEWDRHKTGNANGVTVSVFDVMTSAWTYPERVRYQVVRQRTRDGNDQPYVPEVARVITHVAGVCAELVGAGSPPSSEQACLELVQWYGETAVPFVERIRREKASTVAAPDFIE